MHPIIENGGLRSNNILVQMFVVCVNKTLLRKSTHTKESLFFSYSMNMSIKMFQSRCSNSSTRKCISSCEILQLLFFSNTQKRLDAF